MYTLSSCAAFVIGPLKQIKDEIIVRDVQPADMDKLIAEAPANATDIYFYDVLSERDPFTGVHRNQRCNFSERLPIPA